MISLRKSVMVMYSTFSVCWVQCSGVLELIYRHYQLYSKSSYMIIILYYKPDPLYGIVQVIGIMVS